MTYFILAQVICFSTEFEITDVDTDIYQIEANNETDAKNGLKTKLNGGYRQVTHMEVEGVSEENLSDSWY